VILIGGFGVWRVRLRLGFATVEPFYEARSNRPGGDLNAFGFLALAVRDVASRLDEASFDEDVSAFLDRR